LICSKKQIKNEIYIVYNKLGQIGEWKEIEGRKPDITYKYNGGVNNIVIY
jgi:hypothetical protein